MPLIIPPAKNYGNPLVMQVSRVGLEPTEGRRQINCEVVWGEYPDYSVNVNLQQNATLALTQIIALSVDNSQCGADVQFYFPDSADVLTIPAYNPKTIVEVFTSSRQFYVISNLNGQIVEPADITRFIVLNYLPPPIAVPTSQEQTAAVALVITGVGGGDLTNLVPATVSGTVEAVSVFYSGPVGGAGAIQYAVQDGSTTPRILGGGQTSWGGGNVANQQLLLLNPCHLRFNNGLNFLQNGANIAGAFSVNILYRTP